MDTKEMFSLINKGEQRGWDEFYKQTYNKAIVAAKEILGKNGNDYENAVQESYLTAYKKIHQLENIESYKSWFNTIVRNTALNQLQGKSSGDFYSVHNPAVIGSLNAPANNDDVDSDEIGNIIDLTEFNPDMATFIPEDIYDQQNTKATIEEALNMLPEDQRRILELKELQGFKFREIADVLNMPENTVKTKHRRALKFLASQKDFFEKRGVKVSGIAMLIMLLKWYYMGDRAYAATFLGEAGKEAVKTALAASLEDASTATATTSATAAASATSATTATTAGTVAGKALLTKAIAGVAAVAVIGGGAYVGSRFVINKSNTPSTEITKDLEIDETNEISENKSSTSTSTYFIIDNDYSKWDIINASDEVKNIVNNIYSEYGDPSNVYITNYTDRILCLELLANTEESKITYHNYDITTGNRLALADVVSNIISVCDEVIKQKKIEYPDFNESYFREVFDSLQENDFYETRIKWRLDHNGLVISLDDGDFSQIAKDEEWIKAGEDVNVTNYVKDEYNTKTSVYGYNGGSYTADDGTFRFYDVTNYDKVTLMAFKGYGDEPYYREDITHGGITVDNFNYYSDNFIIKNNDKAYFYIQYDDLTKMLVYDITTDTPSFIGVYEGSYFPRMVLSNTDHFPMYHSDGTYGWYTIADSGMPVSLDEQIYTVNESNTLEHKMHSVLNDTIAEATNEEISSLPSNDIEAKFEEYIKTVPKEELGWDIKNLRYQLIYLNDIPCIFFSFGTATANSVEICTYQNGAIQKPQYVIFSQVGSVGYTTSGYILAEMDRMGYINHAIYTIGDGEITEVCCCVYSIDEDMPNYTTEYDEFRINGVNVSRDEVLQYYDSLIASIGSDENVFDYYDGKPLSGY